MFTINQGNGKHVRDRVKVAALVLALGAFFVHAGVAASQAPSVTTQLLVPSTTVANGQVVQLIQGTAGGAAINKFGDVFVPSQSTGTIYEFSANGAAPFAIFTATCSCYQLTVGGVYVDNNQNLFVTVTNFGGKTPGGDSAIYELPFVNGAYPAPVTETGGVPLPQCSAAPTSTCAWGNYLAATGYYYQPRDITFDGSGNGYMVTSYDLAKANNIYACNAACGTGAQNGTILVGGLPNPVLSLSADAAGDVFYADGSSSIYEVVAGTTTSVPLGTGLTSTRGVRLDRAGNIFITDATGLFEIPLANGGYSTSSQVEIATQYQISQYSTVDYNGAGVAADLHGNVYMPDGYQNLVKINIHNGNFGSAATASGTASTNFNVVFNEAAASTTITPTGAQASEFSVSNNTCGGGGAVGATCSFTGTFQPAGVGLRKAAFVFADSPGSTTNVTLAGVGQGAGVTVDPGSLSQVDTGFSSAAGVAVDAAGNIFIADTTGAAVYEYPAGGGARLPIGTGLVSPSGVATDGAGNLYISDLGSTTSTEGRVVEVPSVSGVLNTVGQTTIATGLGAPKGIFVDGYGTLYVADSASKDVFVLPPTQFGEQGGAVFGTGLSGPTDVTTDSSGNVYIADAAANQVVAISIEGGQSQVGSGFSNPTGVAIDASGSVIVADQGNKRIVRVPNESGTLNATDEFAVETAIGSPYAVRSDAIGNLIVSDNTANVLDFIDRTDASVIFTSVNVGTTSAPQTVTLSSEGNLGLALSSPLYAPPASPFALVEQGTAACADGTTLNAGVACTLSATFSPTAKNTYSALVQLSTSALNTSSPEISLSGMGLYLATPTVTLQQTSPTGTPTYGQTITLTATVGGTPASGGTPTGYVALVIDGATQPSVALVNGVAVLTVTGASGGQHSYQVNYLGDNNYAATSSSVLQITVLQVSSTTTLAITADAVAPLSSAAGDTVTFSSVLTPSAPGYFSGTVSYVSNGNTLATGNVTPGANGTYTASATSNTLAPGTYQVTAVYSGNANYTSSSSSPPITLIIVATPTIVVTPASASITTSRSTTGSTLLTITSYAGFQGAVDFACSGLPAYASCVFTPAVVTLIASSTSPLTVPTYTTVLSVPVNQAPLVTPTSISPWAGALLLLLLLRVRRLPRSWKAMGGGLAMLLLLIGMTTGLTGCGSSTTTTPTGTSTITVTATATPSTPGVPSTSNAGSVTSSFTVQLTVQ